MGAHRICIVDAKNLLFFCQQGGDPAAAFVRKLASAVAVFPGLPVLVWDYGIPGLPRDREQWNWRRLEPHFDYKGNRRPSDISRAVKRSMLPVAKTADRLSIVQAGIAGLEADDVVGFLCGALERRGCQIAIVSNDRDYYQLVGGRVVQLRPVQGRWEVYDEVRVRREMGVAPEDVAKVKAVAGDSGDHFQPVAGVGFATARQYVCVYGLDPSCRRWLDLPAEVRARFSGFKRIWERFHTSYRLAHLAKDPLQAHCPEDLRRRAAREIEAVAEDLSRNYRQIAGALGRCVVDYCRGEPASLRDMAPLAALSRGFRRKEKR
jgi:hypothetical protein